MVFRNIKVNLLIILILIPTIVWAVSSGTSYKITTEILDAGAANLSSTSYRVLAKGRDRQISLLSSSGYIFGAGFMKSAYFSKPTPILNPVVTAITPSTAVNTGTVDITNLAGANFATGATVKLSKSGETDISAINVVVVSSSSITCTFDLTDKTGGLWNITVTNSDGRSGTLPSAFKITYQAPTIDSITPNRGTNNGAVSITNLAGSRFRTGATVKLSMTGESDITGTNITVASAAKITCQFDLTSKMVGLWDLIVTNDDGQSVTLTKGFKIEAPQVEVIGVVKNTPNPFNPSTGGTVISYSLSRDTQIELYIYNIRGERVWTYAAPAGTAGGTAGVNQVAWDGMTAFKSSASVGVYILHVVAKVDGTVKILSKTKIAVVK